jgi:hypothetical protein
LMMHVLANPKFLHQIYFSETVWTSCRLPSKTREEDPAAIQFQII